MMRGVIYAIALALAVLPNAWGSTASEPVAGNEWRFRVLLDGKEVGWHRYVVRDDGAHTEIDSRAQISVRFLFLDAYRYRHVARERWLGPCLDTLESRTETNGTVERVEATTRGNSLVVSGPSGDSQHAECVMSFAYWDPRILGASRLLNSQTGELLPVRVTDRGTDVVSVAGHSVEASRHRLSAPGLQIDLWYAGDRWIALEAPTPGGRLLRYEIQ